MPFDRRDRERGAPSRPLLASFIAALLLLAADRGHAQCVVEGIVDVIEVRVDRGDGAAIAVTARSTAVSVTVPPRAGVPLAVEVRGALALSGTTRGHALALRAGTHAGGVIEVTDGGRAEISSARSIGDDVRVDVELGGLGRVRDMVVPCASLTTLAPRAPRGRRSAAPTPPPRLASRRRSLSLRSGPGDGTEIVLADLERWHAAFETVETSGSWARVRALSTYSGVTLSAWVPARALAPPGVVPRGPATRPIARVRCGTAIGGAHDPEHAIVAEGTPVSLAAGGPRWTATSGERSFLVRVVGDVAEILAAPGLRADRMVAGCPRHVVLGTVPVSALDRDVFSHDALRVRRDDEGRLHVERSAIGTLRSDLSVGDIVIAMGGVPLDRRMPAYMLVRRLVTHRDELSLTVLRDGAEIALPRIAAPGGHAEPGWRRSDLELALED